MLKHITLTLTVILTLILNISAQVGSNSIRGSLRDGESGLSVAGAVIELTPTATPDNKLYYSSEMDGSFVIQQLLNGEYTINITFLGYNTETQTFTLAGGDITLPTITMLPSSTEIEAVVKEVKALRASQQGDTLNYSAASFKTSTDADVESLIQKMPGITIDDGTVSAQGEEVQKIYVDGREFFGDDVATALKSLPAEVVASIEVYDKLSDNAELSGIDDGNSTKAINIVNHKSMRKGIFGKLYAGYAYEPDAMESVASNKYLVGGNLSLFNEARRLSVIFLFNNLDQVNFSFEDIMGTSGESDTESSSFMVKTQSGISVVNAIGVNYSDAFGADDKLKLQGSYFFNGTDTYNLKSTTKWYDEPANTESYVTSEDTRNFNNRLNGRLDWKINKSQSLMIRPSISLQSNDPLSITTGTKVGESYTLENGYADGYRDISGFSDGFWSGYNVGLSLNYRAKLDSKGRLITLSSSYNRNDYSNDYDIQDFTYTKVDELWERNERYRYKDAESIYEKFSADLMYMEPLSKRLSLTFNYKYETTYQEANTITYITDENYNIEEVYSDGTSRSDSRYDINKAGVGLRYAKNKTNIVLKGYYENSQLNSNVVKDSGSDSPKRTFTNFTYFSMANININQENSMKFRLSSYSTNPSISKLQDIYSIGNNMSRGNPDLDPSYSNRLHLQYTKSNLEKGNTFMFMMSFRHSMDYISNHIVYEPNEFTLDGSDETYDPLQYSIPVNVDNYWEAYSRFTFGFPMDFISSNLNIGGGVSYSLVPSIIGGEVQSDGSIEGGNLTNTDNIGYRLYATLGSNISENVDFTLKWKGEYNIATNSSSAYESENRYLDHEINASVKLVFTRDLTFTGSLSYNQYLGYTDSYNDQAVVCNLFVGRKVFKSRRGEVLGGVCDLFNQNRSFSRSTGTNYSQNQTNSVIGRYFTLQFVYNLRAFAKGASRNMSDYKVDKSNDERGGRM